MDKVSRDSFSTKQWLVLEIVRGRQVGHLWEIGGRSVAEPAES
jgi:hypothetical protein